ncbi:MAG TPA: hypothetical protein VH187_13665 [Scandinavium sp.]|jgi:hypothetical protein|uniref:hypothetical protein n=1 Tax=Scandinavium sp. TaxID=2830653 RepID=UPI002E344B6F|nr:hypothetical protein [Scandinavium sp.]HEX4502179.1 hypothetical protein [Scandinavium sp.]
MINGNMKVTVTQGISVHVDPNCRGLWRGREMHLAKGNDLWVESTMTIDDAADQGKFACYVCWKSAGIVIPAELDRELQRSIRREAKAAAKAAKLAVVEPIVETVVETTVEATVPTTDEILVAIAEMMRQIDEMLAMVSV